MNTGTCVFLNYACLGKSERGKQISYMNTYIWSLEKNVTDEHIWRAGIEMQTETWGNSAGRSVWDKLIEQR